MRPLAWTYRCEALQPELAGWRHPVWRGSDDWPGTKDGRYWRSTIAIRIPSRRYLIIAIPIRRKHTEGNPK